MSQDPNSHVTKWCNFLESCHAQVALASPYQIAGRLTRINGLVMEAAGIKLPLGSNCSICVPGGGPVEAEVVGFSGEKLYMMPSEDIYGLAPGALVSPLESLPPILHVGAPPPLQRRQLDRAKHVPVSRKQ